MESRTPPERLSIPPLLLVADLLGTVLLVLGALELTSEDGFLPAAWRVPHLPWLLFLAGVALMAPFVAE